MTNPPIDTAIIINAVILIIVVLVVLCLRAQRIAIHRLRDEAMALLTLGARLQDFDYIRIEQIAREQNLSAEEAVLHHCRSEDKAALPEGSIGRECLRLVARATRTRMMNADILSDLVPPIAETERRFAGFVAGILVFVALIGTVTSLAAAISSLPRLDANSDNFAALNNVVLHLWPAFLVTAVGLVGTLIVGAGNYRLSQQVAQYARQQDIFVYGVLGPLLLPGPVEEARQWRDLVQQTVRALGKEVLSVAQELKTELSQELSRLHTSLTGMTDAWEKQVSDAIRLFGSGVEKLGEAEKTISGELLTSVRETRDLMLKGSEVKVALQNTAVALTDTMTNLNDKLTRTMESLRISLAGDLDVLNGRLQTVADNVLKVEGIYDRLDMHLTGFRDGQQEVHRVLQATLKEWEKDVEMTRSVKSIAHQTFMEVQNSLRSSERRNESQHATHIELLRDLSDKINDTLNRLTASQQKILSDMTDIIQTSMRGYNSTLETQVGRLATVLNAQNTLSHTQTGRLEAALGTLRTGLDAQTTRIENALNAQNTLAEAQTRPLKEVLESQNAQGKVQTEQLKTVIEEQGATVQRQIEQLRDQIPEFAKYLQSRQDERHDMQVRHLVTLGELLVAIRTSNQTVASLQADVMAILQEIEQQVAHVGDVSTPQREQRAHRVLMVSAYRSPGRMIHRASRYRKAKPGTTQNSAKGDNA